MGSDGSPGQPGAPGSKVKKINKIEGFVQNDHLGTSDKVLTTLILF